MKRDSYMDLLKGILIILVIVGHTVEGVENMDILFNVIYSFHMPFMIFISGYLEEKNADKYAVCKNRMILMRAGGLLIPYICWTVIGCMSSMSDKTFEWKHFWDRLMGYTQTGLWFLAVLFGLKVMHNLLWRIKRKKYIGIKDTIVNVAVLLLLESILVLVAYVSRFPYLINMISYAIPYFMGVLMVRDEWIQNLTKNKGVIALCLIIYGAGICVFSFYDTNWTTQVLRIILSCSFIIVIMCLKEYIGYNKGMEMLCVLGKNSMMIYLLHGMFIGYGPLLSFVDSAFVIGIMHFVMAIVVAVVCLSLGKLLCYIPYVGRVLFGVRHEEKVIRQEG